MTDNFIRGGARLVVVSVFLATITGMMYFFADMDPLVGPLLFLVGGFVTCSVMFGMLFQVDRWERPTNAVGRIREDLATLDANRDRLAEFLDNPTTGITGETRELMEEQADVMRVYSNILAARLLLTWGKTP